MKELFLAMAIANGADVSTSLVAFHHGAWERNPFILSTKPAPFIAQTAASTAGEIWLLNKLSKKHPKWAKGLVLAQVGVSVWAASLNARVISRQKAINQRCGCRP